MAQAEFSYSGEAHPLPGARTLVRGTRTSGGGRAKKHVFIEVECLPEEVEAAQKALGVLPSAPRAYQRDLLLTVRRGRHDDAVPKRGLCIVMLGGVRSSAGR